MANDLLDQIRSTVHNKGLTAKSEREFYETFEKMFLRKITGPSPYNTSKLLALIDAGIIDYSIGPSPDILETKNCYWEVHSTAFQNKERKIVNAIIESRIPTNERHLTRKLVELGKEYVNKDISGEFRRNQVPETSPYGFLLGSHNRSISLLNLNTTFHANLLPRKGSNSFIGRIVNIIASTFSTDLINSQKKPSTEIIIEAIRRPAERISEI